MGVGWFDEDYDRDAETSRKYAAGEQARRGVLSQLRRLFKWEDERNERLGRMANKTEATPKTAAEIEEAIALLNREARQQSAGLNYHRSEIIIAARIAMEWAAGVKNEGTESLDISFEKARRTPLDTNPADTGK